MTKKNKIILGLVGEIAAGKGEAARYLVKKYSASHYRFSDPLRDVLKRLGLEINRENQQDISTILRQRFGQDLLAKIIAGAVKEDQNKVIAVEGIRRPEDIIYLEKMPEFKLVYITAPMEIRYARLTKRGENTDDNAKSYEQFLKDHEKETEKEIENIGQKAAFKIDNSGETEGLYQEIDKIINI